MSKKSLIFYKPQLEGPTLKKLAKGGWPLEVQVWLDRVQYDLETAQAMFKTGRYLYVVFMCQQSIEKAFKATLALQSKEIKPIHNLSRLASLADLLPDLDDEKCAFIDDLSAYYLNARYKETIESLSQVIGKEESKTYLKKTQEFITWLIQKMKPSP